MDVYLTVGTRNSWSGTFRETLTLFQQGLSHGGIFVLWSGVKKVVIMYYKTRRYDGSRWHQVIRDLYWEKITITMEAWEVVVDCRSVRASDEKTDFGLFRYLEGTLLLGDGQDISDSYDKVERFLQSYCPQKIEEVTPLGGFDLKSWDSWWGSIIRFFMFAFLAGCLMSMVFNLLSAAHKQGDQDGSFNCRHKKQMDQGLP